MILNSPYISGSLTVTGNEVITGSLTVLGGITGAITGSATSASYSFNASYLNNSGSGEFVPTGSFNTFSSSILSYTASNNTNIGNIHSTTASLNTFSGSTNSRLSSIESTTASLNTASGSAITRLSALEVTSGSNITRIGALEAASGSAITRLSALEVTSGSNISRLSSLESKTGSYATTGSNTFVGGQYISQSSNPTGFTTTASLYTDGGLRVGRDAYISGTLYLNNVTVYGTQSVAYISSSQLNIGTNLITVNTDTPSIRFGGLAVYDSGSTGLTGSILWDSQNNHWIYSNPSGSSYSGGMFISGPRTSTLGSETGTTSCMLLVGQGGDHLTSSMIYHSSTVTCIPTAIAAGSTACFAGNLNACSSVNVGLNLRISTSTSAGNATDPAITTGGCTKVGVYFDGGCVGLGSGGNTLILTQTGKVGIGTQSPDYGNLSIYCIDNTPLSSSVWGTSTAAGVTVAVYNGSQCANSVAGLRLITRDSGASIWNIYNVSTGPSAGALAFGNGSGGTGYEKLRITDDGITCFACTVCIGGEMVVKGNAGSYNTHYFTTGASNVAKYIQYNASGTAINQIAADAHSYFNSGCNVGIGTPTPTYTLDVTGTARVSGNTLINSKLLINSSDTGKTPLLLNAEGNYATSGNMTTGFAITNTSFGRALNMGVYESGAYAWMQAAYINNADTTFALSLQPRGGNVGIGLTNPSCYYSNQLVVSAGSEGGITIANPGTTGAQYIMFADGTSGADRYRGYMSYNHTDNSMTLATDANTRFTITGTGITCFACQVCAKQYSSTFAADGDNIATLINSASTYTYGPGGVFIGSSTANNCTNLSGGNGALIIRNGSSTYTAAIAYNGQAYFCNCVGIGTPSPIAQLQICSSDGQLRLSGDGRAQMILNTYAKTWQFETSCGAGNVAACAIGLVEAGVGTRFQIHAGGVASFACQICLKEALYVCGTFPRLVLDRSATSAQSDIKFVDAGSSVWSIGTAVQAVGSNLDFYNYSLGGNVLKLNTTGEACFKYRPQFPGASLICSYTCSYSSYTAGCWLGLFAGDNGFNGAYAFTVVGQFNLGGSGLYTMNFGTVPYIHKSDSIGSTNGNDSYWLQHNSSGHADNGALVCFRRTRFSGNTPAGNRTEFCMNVSYNTSFTATTYVLAWV
jgi:hypothetical protein